jgi:hypothetical protein
MAPAAGVADDPAAAAATSGHLRMAELLVQVARETAAENPLMGDGPAVALRAQLAQLPPTASPRTRTRLLRQLGEQELRLGNVDAAIRHLGPLHREMEQLYAAGRVRDEAAYTTAYRLGVAQVRLGETQNCCLRNTPESCILPIRGEGVHRDPRGSRDAIVSLTRAVELAPEGSPIHLKAKWLLNIAYMTLGDYPHEVPERHRIQPATFESGETIPRFENRAPALGLDNFDLAGGAIADDFDGDGNLDIVVSTWEPTQPMRLFHNNGDGTFSDHTERANLADVLGGFNLVQADYDNDGDLDILVLRGAWLGRSGRFPNSLLRNNGNGTFSDVTFDAGLAGVYYPTQAADWADYDGDGDLDLYIGNETHEQLDAPCQLFRNNGDGTFTDVAEQAGVLNRRFAKSVSWGDYDADGDPDLYVSNLGSANRLYRNDADGTFTDVADRLDVTGPRASFASWFWDADNDGTLDLFVAGYDWRDGGLVAYVASLLGRAFEGELAKLYRGNGRGGFEEVAASWGLTRLTLPMGANFGDLDGDGYPDFYLGTGYPDFEALMPNVMYLNRGGTGFSDVTSAGGFGHLQKGHAVAFADLDNDGDQDLFAQIGGMYVGDPASNALFVNPGFDSHWITVRLEGVHSNRFGIGARIRVDVVEDGSPRTVYRYVNSGGSFGANPLRQTIGLGRAERISRVEVLWPWKRLMQELKEVPLDGFIRVVEGREGLSALDLSQFSLHAESAGQ